MLLIGRKLTLLLLIVTTITCGRCLATISPDAAEVSYASVVTWTHWPPVASRIRTTTYYGIATTHTSVVANTFVLIESRVRSLAPITGCKPTIEAFFFFVLFMPGSCLLLLLWSCRL